VVLGIERNEFRTHGVGDLKLVLLNDLTSLFAKIIMGPVGVKSSQSLKKFALQVATVAV
jgi:hypothetical protein